MVVEIDGPIPVLVCDEPAEGAVVTFDSVVWGWSYSPSGLEAVEVWLDDQRLGGASTGRGRPDVAADHPDWPGVKQSGFYYRIDTVPASPLPREGELVLVATDRVGNRSEVRRAVRVEAPPLPLAGSLDVPVLRALTDPLRESGWSSPLVVYGWAVDPAGIDRIDVAIDGRTVAEAQYGLPREDVQGARADYRRAGLAARCGWQAVVPTEGIEPGQHLLSATAHGGSGELPLGPVPIWLRAESVRVDPERQRRLDAVLRCPGCGGGIERNERGVVCVGCDRVIAASEFGTLLFEETYAGLDWRGAGLTSHGYPPAAIEVILGVGDGLVLDIGAGLRENLPNVVQLDAFAYPTTDVSADAARLPFADESFDGVVACNLLEHVANQADVVREMRRVCKRGGRLYADCTSVHPYHGFPHHYFNATVTGLEWLMREVGGGSGRAFVEDNRLTVKIVLEAWLGSLNDPEARDFAGTQRVRDLLALLNNPGLNPRAYASLDDVFADGRRLIPAKVSFDGVRER